MILIVDDDPSVTTSLELLLKQNGHVSRSAAGPGEALDLLEAERFDLVLQDMNFSRETTGREGLELLARIRAKHPRLPVILITAWGSIALAVEGIKAGASDFLTKPWTNTHLIQSVETVLSLADSGGTKALRDVPRRAELDARYDFGRLVGEDPEFLRVLELVGRVAPTDASVLITGESGTGKELVAEALHGNGRRRDRPFVKVNLGGISSTLFESEMFGHVRGAFTDARADRKGRFEVADGGTIFLDEIGELDPSSQVKLLRVLQDRTFEVLGSSVTRAVDVRVVSATNRDLAREVENGRFREDLLYRLNLISVRVPTLRERRSDIPVLARHLLERRCTAHGRDRLELTPAAVTWLQSRPWPGNVRQLQQTLERAALVVESDRIDEDDLVTLSSLDPGARRDDDLPRPGSMTLDEMERAMIVNCLRQYDGNVTRVARALGLSRAALYRRLEKYGLEKG
jgi:DNA-binding NtrC family response regulator